MSMAALLLFVVVVSFVDSNTETVYFVENLLTLTAQAEKQGMPRWSGDSMSKHKSLYPVFILTYLETTRVVPPSVDTCTNILRQMH